MSSSASSTNSSILNKSTETDKSSSKGLKALKHGFDFSFKNTRKPATQPSEAEANAARHLKGRAAAQHADLDVMDYFVGKSDSWHIAGSACRTQ